MYRVTAFDTVIDSGFPLPGAIPRQGDGHGSADRPDITIIRGSVEVPADAEPAGMYRCQNSTVWFPDAGIAGFACHRDGRIVVEPASGASDDLVGQLLIASALPAMLWLRRIPVLHAGAAILPGGSRAIAIGGIAGAGKSTVLEQLIGAGAHLVGDDAICVSTVGDRVMASGLPGGCLVAGSPGARKADRVFRPAPQVQQCRSAQLGAFIHLDLPAPRAEPVFARVTGVNALELLLNARHRPEVARLLGQEPEHLKGFATISRSLTVYRWSRKQGSSRLGDSEWRFLGSLKHPHPPPLVDR